MRYYIIAGERSGDLHASNLMKELRKKDPGVEFRTWGGDRMKQQGATLVKHIDELAFMGFAEVIKNLPTIFKNISLCKQDIIQYKPDAIIFIDYPGFNLRIAKFAKQQNIHTVYYISPQVWAWHKSRVKRIKRDIDHLLVILPFEKEFFIKYDVEATFTGHPLLDALGDYEEGVHSIDFRKENNLSEKPIVALLPGSRAQEISRMLGTMSSVVRNFPEYQFVIAGISAHSRSFYEKYINSTNISLIFEKTYPLLFNSEAALVASGTATLETALIGVPQVVCYKASAISYMIARRLVDIEYISLVNLIMDKQVVKELIQHDFNEKSVTNHLNELVANTAHRNQVLNDYQVLREKLGGRGASKNAAESIINFLNQKHV
jgi:lipid-A-disaccharide synthase